MVQDIINEADCPDNLLSTVRKYYDASYSLMGSFGYIHTKDFDLTFRHGTKWNDCVLAHHNNLFLGAYEHEVGSDV